MKSTSKRTPTHRRTANRPANDTWLIQTTLTPTQAKPPPPTRSDHLVMTEYEGSIHREIIAIKYAFPEGKKPYGTMFAFKPHSALGPSLLDYHISVIHNTTMRATDHIVALGDVLKNLLHPDHFTDPTPPNAK